MADWLVECGVELAAMESTATYGNPVLSCLEDRVECWLLNDAHMKAVPGRKTDVKGAEAMTPWAHELGLLQTIPGVGLRTAQVFIAETGVDMSRFPTAGHLAAWVGLARRSRSPRANATRPVGTRHGNKFLTSMLVAHSMLVSAYYTVIRDEPYHDLGPAWLDERARNLVSTRRLVTQLERLGHTVVLDPEAPPAA